MSESPRGVPGKVVLIVLAVIAVSLIVLTAVLTWGRTNPYAKPPDSPIFDRDLVPEEGQ